MFLDISLYKKKDKNRINDISLFLYFPFSFLPSFLSLSDAYYCLVMGTNLNLRGQNRKLGVLQIA